MILLVKWKVNKSKKVNKVEKKSKRESTKKENELLILRHLKRNMSYLSWDGVSNVVRVFTMEGPPIGPSHSTSAFGQRAYLPVMEVLSYTALPFHFISTSSLFYFNFLLEPKILIRKSSLVRFFTTSCRPGKHALHHSVYDFVVGIATGRHLIMY